MVALVGPLVLLTGIGTLVTQPLASVIFTVYNPEHKLSAVAVVSPLLHKYVYPGVPPVGASVAVPSHKLQVAPVIAAFAETGGVAVIVVVKVSVHPSESVMSTE